MLARHIIRRQCRRILITSKGTRSLHAPRRLLQQEPPASAQVFDDPSVGAALREHVLNAQRESEAALNPAEDLLEEEGEDFIDDVTKRDPKYLAVLAQETADLDRIDSWKAYQHIRTTTGSLGSKTSRGYKPNSLIRNPPYPHELTLELLLAAQAHLGHATSLWHPANSRYIFGVRSGIHIIDLSLTLAHLRRACKVVEGVAERGGIILIAGTRAGSVRSVVNAAKLAGGYHLFSKWIPGTITNGPQLLGKCKQTVVDEFDREVHGFDEQLIGRGSLKPDLVVCLNPPENYVLLHECSLHGIPTIGIVDTDQNPTWVTYPIPANDDSTRTISVIAGALGRAGQLGQQKRRELALKGEVLFDADHGLTAPSRNDAEDAQAFSVSDTTEGKQAATEAVQEGAVSAEEVVVDKTVATDGSVEQPPEPRLASGVVEDQTAPSHVPGMKIEHATSDVAFDNEEGLVPDVNAGASEEVDTSKRAAKREQAELNTGRSEVGGEK